MTRFSLICLLCLCMACAACEHSTKWTTDTGIQITELREGEGEFAKRGDLMRVLYTASFVGGKTFDTQMDPDFPYEFRLGMHEVMPGLDEGVRTMRRGGKRILVIPPEQAWGKEGIVGTVPPNTPVRFEIELLEIMEAPPAPDPWNEAGKDIVTTDSGLQIVDFVVGKGAMPTPKSTVTVMYSAFLDDGTCFDTTYLRGVPLQFSIADKQLIQGWVEGLMTMRVGGERKLIIPPYLAYGEKGFRKVVPPNATLVYDIELLEVEEPAK